MVHAQYFSWFDAGRSPVPQPWELEPGAGPGPVPNAAFFAEVFREVEDELVRRDPALAEPLRRLRVVLTPNHGVLPFTGPDVVALLVWDNWARVPRWADQVALTLATNRDRRFGDARGMLTRPLGWAEVLDEARVRVERERWARQGRRPARGAATIVPVPLGFAHQREVPWVPWEERDIDVFFAGSTSHGLDRGGPVRRRLRVSVGNVKTLHRQHMMAAVERLREAAPDLAVRVDIVDADHVADHADSYSDRMARSRFCLDPRGTSRETFRFYEAVRVGSVPVVTSLPRGGLYAGAPALRLRHWSDLTRELRRLQQQPEEARALHEATQQWYRERGGPQATAARLVPHVEQVLRRLPQP